MVAGLMRMVLQKMENLRGEVLNIQILSLTVLGIILFHIANNVS